MWNSLIRDLSRITANETFTEWQGDFVGPLYRQARSALGDPMRMTVVQIDLMKHIYALQEIRTLQRKEHERAARESGKAGQRGHSDLAKKLAKDALHAATMRDSAVFAIRQLREIGDMLAWKTLRNRMAIRLMATKNAPGDLPPWADYKATLFDAAREADQLQSYPLFTDVTNLLRHGDVLYVPWNSSRVVHIEELKGRSGGDRRRHSRQLSALADLDRLLNTGTGTFAGQLYHLRWCNIPLRHHFGRLTASIQTARRDGLSSARISENHAVNVMDFSDLDRLADVLERAEAGPTDSELVDARPDDELLSAGLLPRIGDVMLPAAPWGVFPLSEADRLSLASLRVLYSSVLNVSGLQRASAKAGAPCELVIDVPSKYSALRVSRAGVQHEIDLTFFLIRVGVEFLDEQVLLELLRQPAWPPPPPGSLLMFEFRDEMTIWS